MGPLLVEPQGTHSILRSNNLLVVYQALLFLRLMVVLGIVKPVASNKRYKYN